MKEALRAAAKQCLSEEDSLPSVTEKEMRLGFSESADSLLFIRELQKSKSSKRNSGFWNFGGEANAPKRLEELKAFVRKRASKVFRYSLERNFVDPISDASYLKRMLQDLLHHVEKKICAAPKLQQGPLFDAVCRHIHFAWLRSAVPDERPGLFHRLKASKGNILVVGPLGCGKSSLLSRFAMEQQKKNQ